jgi:TPP-dependent pyruvate/acetoin dehydrogenase alpha subunit
MHWFPQGEQPQTGFAIEALRAVLRGRRFDELCVQLRRRGLMVTFAPGIGQEACAVILREESNGLC